MLYGSRLRGYTSYTHELQSGPTKRIILWMTHKRKLANSFILFRTLDKFSYRILPIIHAYNAGISRLRLYVWLWSYAWLRSHVQTPVDVMTLTAHHGSDRWACHMYYHLSYEKLRMAGLDDCSILHPKHLVRSRLGGTHDSISVQNLISHNFTCGSNQAMSHVTKEHLAWHDLRKIWVSGGIRYPATLKDQGLRMSG
jgi:hypothetical protein